MSPTASPEEHANLIASIKESLLTEGPCPVCGTVMATRHGMKRHFKIIHKRAEMCKCELCDRSFLTNFALHRHAQRVHRGDTEADQVCPFCSKQFFWKHSLDRHLRIVHQNVEFGVCPTCGKSFSNKFALNRHHKNSHANSLHICARCNLKFTSKYAISDHNLKTHNLSKIFACDQCPFCFLDPNERQKHINELHT